MASLIQNIHRWEKRFDRQAEAFAFRHPCLAFLAVFFGAPVLVLSAVPALTMTITFPVSLFFGWV